MGPTEPDPNPGPKLGTEYYLIGDVRHMRSADGRKWYAEQKDGSMRKCPPNMCIYLEKQRALIHADRDKEDLDSRLHRPASPTGGEPPAASSDEAQPSPASTDEP